MSGSRAPKRHSSKKASSKHSGGPKHTADYLKLIGVRDLPPATSPFDPGYDPATVASHLAQSNHLICILKISMA